VLFKTPAAEGKTVSVTGVVKMYRGKPEIVLNSPSQIKGGEVICSALELALVILGYGPAAKSGSRARERQCVIFSIALDSLRDYRK
jgi:hypothetical protein